MVWTSQKFCSHGLEHGSCNDDGDGIIQKLSKQFLIVIKLQGCVCVTPSYCEVQSHIILFLEFSSF